MSVGMVLSKRRRLAGLEAELAALSGDHIVKRRVRYTDGSGRVRYRTQPVVRELTRREERRIEELRLVVIPKAIRVLRKVGG